MLLILKKLFFDLIIPRYFPIGQSKEMSQDFVRGQFVVETCFSHWGYVIVMVEKSAQISLNIHIKDMAENDPVNNNNCIRTSNIPPTFTHIQLAVRYIIKMVCVFSNLGVEVGLSQLFVEKKQISRVK